MARRLPPERRRRSPGLIWLAVGIAVLVAAGLAGRGSGGEADAHRAAGTVSAASVVVPQLRGLPAAIAQGQLCRMGLPSVAQGVGPRRGMEAGAVLRTRPAAGARARPGRIVQVLAAGAPDGRYIVRGCR